MKIQLARNHSWAIAYINRDFVYRVERDLQQFPEYSNIKVYIPMVRILKKQFKGRDIFEEIPFLFNYGFFQIPNKNLDIDFLNRMKEKIPCIQAWVKDSKTVISTKPSLISGKEPLVRKDMIQVALATKGEISNIIRSHKMMSLYDKFDIENLKEGMIIKLKGYPFDDMDARVIKVDEKKEKVEVELLLEGLIKKSAVSFDNIFYSIYEAYEEDSLKEKRLEDIKSKSRNYERYNRDHDS